MQLFHLINELTILSVDAFNCKIFYLNIILVEALYFFYFFS